LGVAASPSPIGTAKPTDARQAVLGVEIYANLVTGKIEKGHPA
jgi:hypothetical protein